MRSNVHKTSAGIGNAAARGFTLLEVMIVIVIILALVGLVTVNLMGSRDEATKGTVSLQLRSIRDALKQFNLTYNRYPTEDEGLAVLWSKTNLTNEEDQAKWRPFLEEPIPTDTWGSPWGYRTESESGRPFDLWSNGPDKQEGTEDDISAWKATGEEDGGSGLPPPPPPSGG